MIENKKIRNATEVSYKGIMFKSKLEKMMYMSLLEHGFNPKYEPATFTIVDKFTSTVPYYDKETDIQFRRRKEAGDKSARKLILKSNIMQGIRYTPDFHFKYNGVDVYIEVKGIENDIFYLKKKLFLKYLTDIKAKALYFEIYTKKQLLQAIEIIKSYEPAIIQNTKTNKGTTR